MGRFLRKPLGALDRIYNLVGKQAPGQLEVDSPITVVHDVSRSAGLSSGLGMKDGYFWFESNQINVSGPGDYPFSINVWGAMEAGFVLEGNLPPQEELQFWHIATTFIGNYRVADITSLDVYLKYSSGFSDLTNFAYLPALHTDANSILNIDPAGAGTYIPLAGDPAHFYERNAMGLPPIIMPKYTVYWGLISTTQDYDLSLQFLIWGGPKGVTPPGLP